MQESAQSNLGLEGDQALVERGDQAKALKEVPLFQALFEESLHNLAIQLASLQPLQRDEFTVTKAQYIAIRDLYATFEGCIQQGDEARDRMAGEVKTTGIL